MHLSCSLISVELVSTCMLQYEHVGAPRDLSVLTSSSHRTVRQQPPHSILQHTSTLELIEIPAARHRFITLLRWTVRATIQNEGEFLFVNILYSLSKLDKYDSKKE